MLHNNNLGEDPESKPLANGEFVYRGPLTQNLHAIRSSDYLEKIKRGIGSQEAEIFTPSYLPVSFSTREVTSSLIQSKKQPDTDHQHCFHPLRTGTGRAGSQRRRGRSDAQPISAISSIRDTDSECPSPYISGAALYNRAKLTPTNSLTRQPSPVPPNYVCQNCSPVHLSAPDKPSRGCVILSIHSKCVGSFPSVGNWGHTTSGVCRTVTLPADSWRRAAVGRRIWCAFDEFKMKNEEERKIAEGPKRIVAPIPWLRWTRPDGSSGQTRSQENFKHWWIETVVDRTDSGRRQPPAYMMLLFHVELDGELG